MNAISFHSFFILSGTIKKIRFSTLTFKQGLSAVMHPERV